MAWTYTTLTQAIKDYTENTETTFSNNISLFITTTEEKILRSIELPAFRKNVTGTITSDNQYLSTPSDFLRTYSLALVSGDGTSWLGTNAENALLYGSLIEAYIFMKGEPDIIKNYTEQFQIAVGTLKLEGDGFDRTDAYRTGQKRIKVS